MRYIIIIVLWILLVSGSQTTEKLEVWQTVYEDENVIIKHHYTLDTCNGDYLGAKVEQNEKISKDLRSYNIIADRKARLRKRK